MKKTSRKTSARAKLRCVSNELLCGIVSYRLNTDLSAEKIAVLFQDDIPGLTREDIHYLEKLARQRGLLKTVPQINNVLGLRIVDRFRLYDERRLHRIHVPSPSSGSDHSTAAAARIAWKILKELGKPDIRLGLGPGSEVKSATRNLAEAMRSEPEFSWTYFLYPLPGPSVPLGFLPTSFACQLESGINEVKLFPARSEDVQLDLAVAQLFEEPETHPDFGLPTKVILIAGEDISIERLSACLQTPTWDHLVLGMKNAEALLGVL